jgi:sterol desaturase/sphingolipid hydroxylase (fatty acid hydroxylase superfamily)
MTYWESVWALLSGTMLGVAVTTLIIPIPFIIAEQLRPAAVRPRWQSYGLNMMIGLSVAVLAAPIGVAAGMAAGAAQAALGWQPLAIPFDRIEAIGGIGPMLKGALLMIAPLILHDIWTYWAHRWDHRLPVLWAFHSMHHSDREMNCTTWGRNHFLQTGWRSFFSVFTLGMIVQLDYIEAGQAALLGQLAFMLVSMFCHSAIRVELPWLDRILVTPQVHRIHHSVEREHYDRNFADLFPILDIVFGTYCAPVRGQFPATGLGDDEVNPADPFTAQVEPVARGLRGLIGRPRHASMKEAT